MYVTSIINLLNELNQTGSNLSFSMTPMNSSTWSELSQNNVSNLTLEYIIDLGPKRDSLKSVIPMTVIYILIFIAGLIGNVCTCVVITRNKSMHTATNYYLFSLAISDLMLLILGLPQELYQLWNKYPYIFGEAFCIIRGFNAETSTNASILTITSFTMERYLAICHPLRAQTMSKLSRAVRFIVFVWMFGALCAIPLAIQFGVVYMEYHGQLVPDSAECTLKRPLYKISAFEISTFFFFILPMTAISVLYVLIGIQLRRSNAMNRCPSSEGYYVTEDIPSSVAVTVNGGSGGAVKHHLLSSSYSHHHQRRIVSGRTHSSRSLRGSNASRRAVIKMLFAVVVAFFLCWAPFHAQRLMAIHVQDPTEADRIVYTVLTYISGVTYYLSATINPILYSIMSLKFRQAFKDTLAHCCTGSANRRYPMRYTYSSHPNSTIRSTLGYDGTDLSIVSDSPRHRTDSCNSRRGRPAVENGKNLVVSKRETEVSPVSKKGSLLNGNLSMRSKRHNADEISTNEVSKHLVKSAV